VKFKDADLNGIPLRIVLGERGLKEGKLEAKWRWEQSADMLPLEGAGETIAGWIKEERKDNARFRNRKNAV
jgi:prolyl-tRNA synthetase